MKILASLIVAFLSLSFQQPDPIQARKQLTNRLIDTLETNIANPSWLDTKAYHSFKDTLYSQEVLALGEEDYIQFFREEVKSLPFTHLNIARSTPAANKKETKKSPPLAWKELDENTAYMRVQTFVTDAAPMVKAVQEIGTDRYDNLIIDLRGNGGGSLDAPVVLGRFLTQEPIDAGVYLTRKWFEKYHRQADVSEYQSFPFLQDFTYSGITKMYENEAFRMVLPGHDQPVFKGKVYILINGSTASACEPLIDRLKNRGIATLVGERSNGGMLSGSWFDLNENYRLFLPIADYQTAEGARIDKVGVSPDIEVHPAEALDYVKNLIIEKETN